MRLHEFERLELRFPSEPREFSVIVDAVQRGVASVDGLLHGIGESGHKYQKRTVVCACPDAAQLMSVIDPVLGSVEVPARSSAVLFDSWNWRVGRETTSFSIASGVKRRPKRLVDVEANRPPYQVGDWWAAGPTSGWDPGWFVGRTVAAWDTMITVYVFGPVRDRVPALAEVSGLRAEDAIDAHKTFEECMFGTPGWQAIEVLGGHEDFDEEEWPMPRTFSRSGGDMRILSVEDRYFNVTSSRVPSSEVVGLNWTGYSTGLRFADIWRAEGREYSH